MLVVLLARRGGGGGGYDAGVDTARCAVFLVAGGRRCVGSGRVS